MHSAACTIPAKRLLLKNRNERQNLQCLPTLKCINFSPAQRTEPGTLHMLSQSSTTECLQPFKFWVNALLSCSGWPWTCALVPASLCREHRPVPTKPGLHGKLLASWSYMETISKKTKIQYSLKNFITIPLEGLYTPNLVKHKATYEFSCYYSTLPKKLYYEWMKF